MSKPELTPWFPADVKPVREGWYLREYVTRGLGEIPDYWDGKVWLIGAEHDGVKPKQRCIAHSKKPWRGLAAAPKGKP